MIVGSGVGSDSLALTVATDGVTPLLASWLAMAIISSLIVILSTVCVNAQLFSKNNQW